MKKYLPLAMAIVIVVASVGYWAYQQWAAISSPPIHGVPAAPGIFELTQPDGSKIDVQARGDEHYSWMETVDGHLIKKDVDGWWR